MELVRRGIVATRSEARAAIDSGLVTVGGVPVPKASTMVDEGVSVRLQGPAKRFVSRGGEKLAGALAVFPVVVQERSCLDVGASTGGFTDCLLQAGAATVVALDVGYGQLAWKLRTDPRVHVIERTNIRHADPTEIGAPFDIIVADLSFISLCTVVSTLLRSGTETTDYLLLVKPQFEAGKGRVGKGGIVRDPGLHMEVLETVTTCLADGGLGTKGVIRSPIRGAGGNIEFLVWARQGAPGVDEKAIAEAVYG